MLYIINISGCEYISDRAKSYIVDGEKEEVTRHLISVAKIDREIDGEKYEFGAEEESDVCELLNGTLYTEAYYYRYDSVRDEGENYTIEYKATPIHNIEPIKLH